MNFNSIKVQLELDGVVMVSFWKSYLNYINIQLEQIKKKIKCKKSRYKNNKNKKIVKRIIGLPNDHVVIKDGYVYVNDKKLDEEYLDNFYTMGNIDVIVPNDEIFVLGDNRSNSRDSRDSSIGTIEISDIIGKVAIRILPINKVTVFD